MSVENLVIYAYFEKDIVYQNNLQVFLKNGICNECDYIFVINGECSIQIPDMPNIKIMRRENIHYDFGAYDFALNNIDIKKYKYFIFLNTSVRGPFVPIYANVKWYKAFTNLIKGNVKLVGTTINILNSNTGHSEIFNKMTGITLPHTHVQSQFFAMDLECLMYLMNNTDLFSNYDYKNMVEFIARKEIMMSQLVLKHGWNISAILPEYQNIDYISLNTDINFSGNNHDPCFPNSCFGRTLHPYDCIFIKTNRGISVNEINSLTKYIFEH